MIPILYDKNEQSFTTNGLGGLGDGIQCTVTQDTEGLFELLLTYPISGKRFKDLTEERWIKAKPSERYDPQYFQIYRVTKPMNGIVSVYARHIKYMLNKIVCKPFSVNSSGSAVVYAKSERIQESGAWFPFTFWQDLSETGDFEVKVPTSIGAVLQAIQQTYGGDWEWNNFAPYLKANRGQDNNVTIRYGKNLLDISQETDITDSYDSIVPYWFKDDVLVHGTGWIQFIGGTTYTNAMTMPVDLSSQFDQQPSVAQLDSAAATWAQEHRDEVNPLKENITVSYVPLYQTEEYKNYAAIQYVDLYDTVHVYYEPLDITADAQVVKTVYDVYNERYESVEVGQVERQKDTVQTVRNYVDGNGQNKTLWLMGSDNQPVKLVLEGGRIISTEGA